MNDDAKSAETVLEKLLSPPQVPDASWFAAASAALQRDAACAPAEMLTEPAKNGDCANLMRCLQEGTFRTQSVVLELLANAISHPSPVTSGKGAGGSAEPENASAAIPAALHLLASDESMPVLSAALALCHEQARTSADKGADACTPCPPHDGAGVADGWRERREGRVANAFARTFVPQRCCEDPTDCEEPAVRERALHLLACLAVRARAEDRGTEVGRKLRLLCTSHAILKDVLLAFRVNSAMVSAAAGEALSKVLLLKVPYDAWRLVSLFVSKHLGTMGTLLADLACEACSQAGDLSGSALISEFMGRVLSLRQEELPKDCCLQGNAVRVALALLLRSLVAGGAAGFLAARHLGLLPSLLVFLRSQNLELRNTISELLSHLARYPGSGTMLLFAQATGGTEITEMTKAGKRSREEEEKFEGGELDMLRDPRDFPLRVDVIIRCLLSTGDMPLVQLALIMLSNSCRAEHDIGQGLFRKETIECLTAALQAANLSLHSLGSGMGAERMQMQHVTVLTHALTALRAVLSRESLWGMEGEDQRQGMGKAISASGWVALVERAVLLTSKQGNMGQMKAAGGAAVCYKASTLKTRGLEAARDLFLFYNDASPREGDEEGRRCARILTLEALNGSDTLSIMAAMHGLLACYRQHELLFRAHELMEVVVKRFKDALWEIRHAAIQLASLLGASGGLTNDTVGPIAGLIHVALEDSDTYVRVAALQAVAVCAPEVLDAQFRGGEANWGRKIMSSLLDSESFVRRAGVSLLQACLFPQESVPARAGQRSDPRDLQSCRSSSEPAKTCTRVSVLSEQNQSSALPIVSTTLPPRVKILLSMLGGTHVFAQATLGLESVVAAEQHGKQWRPLLARCMNDIDWEVGLRTLELLRRLAGIPGPALVDVTGRWMLDAKNSSDFRGGAEANAVSEWCHALFWEGGGGELIEAALGNPDKPLRLSAAALVLRWEADDNGIAGQMQAILQEEQWRERRAFLGRLPALKLRARWMLETCQDEIHVRLEVVNEGQLECAD